MHASKTTMNPICRGSNLIFGSTLFRDVRSTRSSCKRQPSLPLRHGGVEAVAENRNQFSCGKHPLSLVIYVVPEKGRQGRLWKWGKKRPEPPPSQMGPFFAGIKPISRSNPLYLPRRISIKEEDKGNDQPSMKVLSKDCIIQHVCHLNPRRTQLRLPLHVLRDVSCSKVLSGRKTAHEQSLTRTFPKFFLSRRKSSCLTSKFFDPALPRFRCIRPLDKMNRTWEDLPSQSSEVSGV